MRAPTLLTSTSLLALAGAQVTTTVVTVNIAPSENDLFTLSGLSYTGTAEIESGVTLIHTAGHMYVISGGSYTESNDNGNAVVNGVTVINGQFADATNTASPGSGATTSSATKTGTARTATTLVTTTSDAATVSGTNGAPGSTGQSGQSGSPGSTGVTVSNGVTVTTSSAAPTKTAAAVRADTNGFLMAGFGAVVAAAAMM